MAAGKTRAPGELYRSIDQSRLTYEESHMTTSQVSRRHFIPRLPRDSPFRQCPLFYQNEIQNTSPNAGTRRLDVRFESQLRHDISMQPRYGQWGRPGAGGPAFRTRTEGKSFDADIRPCSRFIVVEYRDISIAFVTSPHHAHHAPHIVSLADCLVGLCEPGAKGPC